MPLHLELSASETVSTPLTPVHAATRKSLHALSLVVAKSKRAVVVTGAGISCSSGIPVGYARILYFVLALIMSATKGLPFKRWSVQFGQVAIPECGHERP